MKAEEARKISEENSDRRAIERLVKHVQEEIVRAAKNGKRECVVFIENMARPYKSQPWNEHRIALIVAGLHEDGYQTTVDTSGGVVLNMGFGVAPIHLPKHIKITW